MRVDYMADRASGELTQPIVQVWRDCDVLARVDSQLHAALHGGLEVLHLLLRGWVAARGRPTAAAVALVAEVAHIAAAARSVNA